MARGKGLSIAGFIIMSGLAVISFMGYLEPGMDALLDQRLRAGNDRYLSLSFDKAIGGFEVMSLWKAGLDIIEGSTVGASVGVTAQLEVGDIVQPAYDYVDIAWKTLFVGAVTLLGTRYMLQAAEMVDSLVLTFTLAGAALLFLTAWLFPAKQTLRGLLRDIMCLGIALTLSLFYLLPLSVWGASKLSEVITAPSIKEACDGFATAGKQLFPDNNGSNDSWTKKVKAIPERIEQIGTYLKEKTTDMVTWTTKLVAGYIFDCIVFPISIFVILLWMTRSVMRYIFHRNMRRNLRDDLRSVLDSVVVRDTKA